MPPNPDDYADVGLWRNTFHPERCGREPYGSAVECCHNDPDQPGSGSYQFRIKHVITTQGRGFMAAVSIWISHVGCGTGDVHYGTDQAAYDKALADGRKLVAQKDADLQAMLDRERKTYTPESTVTNTTP